MPISRIPDIPGALLENPDAHHHLSHHVASLCGLRDAKFPGSQPVSFSSDSLELLEKKDFWVCEKSDGVRVLLFVVMNAMSGNQEVWLIDRKQRYFFVDGLHFTHWERADDPLTDTILDGELVIDVNPDTGAETLRYYAFDCIVLGGENIMKKPLVKRFARLREWVIAPLKRALQRFPDWKDEMPFEIVAKEQELSYHITQVLKVHVPKLQHGHDGLIFTCSESEYLPGTDNKILKWKPPSENSVDFRIELRFPPSPDDPEECDWFAKPVFLLNQWAGGDRYEYFDELEVDDDEWEKIKESGEEYDDRVAEVHWDMERQAWRWLRFRDDKPHGNHKSIVVKILQSIEDGVEIADVLARETSIRTSWKQRAQQRERNERSGGGGGGGSRPPPQQQQPQPQRRPPPPPSHQSSGSGRPAPGGSQGVMVGLKR